MLAASLLLASGTANSLIFKLRYEDGLTVQVIAWVGPAAKLRIDYG